MALKSSVLMFSCSILFCATPVKASGNTYPGQPPVGSQAVLFAPGLISDGFNNRDVAMMPDGSEIYYSVNIRNYDLSTIMVVYRRNGRWAAPVVAPFAVDRSAKYLEPAISPAGAKFFFVSAKRDGGNNNDIWVMDRLGSGWGSPRKLGGNINTLASETFPSVTDTGTLYFTRADEGSGVEHIYRSRWIDGKYAEAEKLPGNVNCGKTQFNAFIAADESYLILSVLGREDSIGSTDYYIVYRDKNDEWSKPVNMGAAINTAGGREYSAYVSRDGRYLFFMSSRLPAAGDVEGEVYSYQAMTQVHNAPENGNSDIYWIDAAVIEQLRPAPR